MLVGFGKAQLFEADLPEVTRETLAPVIADRAGLARLADAVLTRVTGPRASAAAGVAQTLRTSPHIDLETRLSRELFELAAARPVVFGATDEPVQRVGRAVPVDAAAVPVDSHAGSPGSGVLALLHAAAAPLAESAPSTVVRQWLSRRWAAWSPARRKLAVGGGAALLAVVVAASAAPGGIAPGSSAASEPTAARSTSPSQSAASPVTPVTPSVVTGDDPLAALPALLGRRTDCLRDLSVLCLDDVAESGSAAWDDDRAAIDALVASGLQPTVISGAGAALVERLGDSALISLAPGSDPASVLLLKGEAGWRIRDYLASTGQSG